MTREEAWSLLTEYNQDQFHLEHAQTVENTMRYFARELGYGEEEDFWGATSTTGRIRVCSSRNGGTP